MSASSFVDQLIGLAREHKRDLKRSSKFKYVKIPTLGADVAEYMQESGYFDVDTCRVFGDMLEQVLDTSNPTRQQRKGKRNG